MHSAAPAISLAANSRAMWARVSAPALPLAGGSLAPRWQRLPRNAEAQLVAGSPSSVQSAETRRLARAVARKRSHGEISDNFLKRRRVTYKTEAIYIQRVAEFEARTGEDLYIGITSDYIDPILDKYVTELYKNGYTFSHAQIVMYAIAWHLALPTRAPSCLVLTKASLKGFYRLSRDFAREPAPWEAWCLIAKWLIDTDRTHGVDYAAALVCMYDHYLGPGEQVSLCFQHIVKPPRAVDPWAIIVCHSDEPRGSHSDNTITTGTAIPERQWVAHVVTDLRESAGEEHVALHNFTLPQLERAFQRAVIALELDKLKLTPHCGRLGGPSTDMLVGSTDLPSVQRRGRWQSLSSVKRYGKHGKLMRQLSLMTNEQRAAGLKAATWLRVNLPGMI